MNDLNRRARLTLRFLNSDPESALRLERYTAMRAEYSEKALNRMVLDLAFRGLVDGTSPQSATVTEAGAKALAELSPDEPFRPPTIETPPITPPAVRVVRTTDSTSG